MSRRIKADYFLLIVTSHKEIVLIFIIEVKNFQAPQMIKAVFLCL